MVAVLNLRPRMGNDSLEILDPKRREKFKEREKENWLDFFEKAKSNLPFLFEIPKDRLQTYSQRLFWAEKIFG